MNVKDINNVFLSPEFIIEFLLLLNKFDLVDDISVRNAIIRKEWIEGKQRGETIADFMSRMANKFCLSEKAIDTILYRPGNKKIVGFDLKVKATNKKIFDEMTK